MRLLKIALIVILAAVVALYGFTAVSQRLSTKNEAPVISCSNDVLEISVQDDKSVLFEGVTAADAQDGDLTAEILMSGISKFTDAENAVAGVDFLVFDSDGNMGSFTRAIRYADYEAPRFAISAPLSYKYNDSIVLLDRLTVTDCIDGDITDSVRVSSLTGTTTSEIYSFTVQVTNSMGDTSELELELFLQGDNTDRPQIALKSYLIYIEQGSTFNAGEYIASVEAGGSAVSKSQVTIEENVDTSEPGTYSVRYFCGEGSEKGCSILTVVVE